MGVVHYTGWSKYNRVKWVFKTKLNENGEIDKCKARLLQRGMHKSMVLTTLRFSLQ